MKIRAANLFVILALTTTRAMAQAPAPQATGLCTTQTPMTNPASGTSWNGWGAGVANTRAQSAAQAGLTAAQVPNLKLKWAFGIFLLD